MTSQPIWTAATTPLSAMKRLAVFLYRRPGLALLLLLAPPLLWLLVFYILPLGALLLQSFFYVDDFSGVVVKQLSFNTYGQLLTADNMGVVGRTLVLSLIHI